MPKITDGEFGEYNRFKTLGTVGEVTKKIGDLEKDNHGQREELRVMKETVPKEDEVVVKKSDADMLVTYKEFGKPDVVKGQLKTGEDAVNGLADVNRRTTAAEFAKAAGLADVTVDTLVALPALSKATFAVTQKKSKDAKGVEVVTPTPEITITSEDGKTTETLTFVDAQEKFPALKGLQVAVAGTVTPGITPAVVVPKQGPPIPAGTAGNMYDKIRADAQASKTVAAEAAAKVPPMPLEGRLGMTQG